jgi:recombination protein RecA
MVDFDIMYGEGISKEGSLLDIGIEHEVIQKSGAWFAYGDERRGQGRENAKQFLKENTEVREQILAEIYEELGLERPAAAGEDVPQIDGLGEAERAAEPAAEPLV